MRAWRWDGSNGVWMDYVDPRTPDESDEDFDQWMHRNGFLELISFGDDSMEVTVYEKVVVNEENIWIYEFSEAFSMSPLEVLISTAGDHLEFLVRVVRPLLELRGLIR